MGDQDTPYDWDSIDCDNDYQSGIVQLFKIYSEEKLTGEDLKKSILEDVGPEELFHPDVKTSPAIYRAIKAFLGNRSVSLVHHSSGRNIKIIASTLFQGEELAKAEMLINAVRTFSSMPQVQPNANMSLASTRSIHNNSSSNIDEPNPFAKVAHNIAIRFKEQDKKFSGAIGESWDEFLQEFKAALNECDVTHTQASKLFHHILTGEAKRFYYAQLHNHALSFEDLVNGIREEYNSSTRQMRALNYLQNIHVRDFINNGRSASEALSNVYSLITRMEPLVPPSHRGNEHKLQFLRRAVLGESWASVPIAGLHLAEYKFEGFHARLDAQIQQQREEKRALSRRTNIADWAKPDATLFRPRQVMFTGQGRYGRDNRRHNYSQRQNHDKNAPLKNFACYNCGGDHRLNECDSPKDHARIKSNIARANANSLQAKTRPKKIQYEVCDLVEEDNNILEHSDDECQTMEDQEKVSDNMSDMFESQYSEPPTPDIINEDIDTIPIHHSIGPENHRTTVFESNDEDPFSRLAEPDRARKGNKDVSCFYIRASTVPKCSNACHHSPSSLKSSHKTTIDEDLADKVPSTLRRQESSLNTLVSFLSRAAKNGTVQYPNRATTKILLRTKHGGTQLEPLVHSLYPNTFYQEPNKIPRRPEAHGRISFFGACLDTGAQLSVVGKKQAQAYCKATRSRFNLQRSTMTFKFGDTVHKSLGLLTFHIAVPKISVIRTTVNVVNADVPLLLGLDWLDEHKLVIDNVQNRLISSQRKWSVALHRKFGHLYLDWLTRGEPRKTGVSEIHFTKSEVFRLHYHFYHPGAQKLFNLIKRAKPSEANERTMKHIKEVIQECRTCQHHAPSPRSFQVTMPGKITFNQEVALDLMWINRRPVLHVICTQTHFSSAIFLTSESAEAAWLAFEGIWALMYIGYPDVFRLDQGSVFVSEKWMQYSKMAGIVTKYSGVQSHNSLGVGERYRAPLRTIYEKVIKTSPSLSPTIALRTAVKSMNDTLGPEGLVPSLLVFGVLPRLPAVNSSLPEHEERMAAMRAARAEMETIVAGLRVNTALRSNLPAAATQEVTTGDRVMVHREETKSWVGSYTVTRVIDKQVWVRLNPHRTQQYNLSKVRLYNGNEEDEHRNEKENELVPITNQGNPPGQGAEPMEVNLTENLHPNDPRCYSKRFIEAMYKEVNGLEERETWKVVKRSAIPKGANVIGGRFVLSLKNAKTHEEKAKARYVAGGHRDKDKFQLVHISTTIRQSSTKIIVSMAASYHFKAWSHDVTQAFLQAKEALGRTIYVSPAKKDRQFFKIQEDEALLLLKPLYGLADSGDYWDNTFDHHLLKDLNLKAAKHDLSLYFKNTKGKLDGVIGTYVDDSLIVGTPAFEKESQLTLKKFISRPREYAPLAFAGVDIIPKTDGFEISQDKHIEKITILPTDCSFSDFRSKRAQLAWIVHTRPEISFCVSTSAQVTESTMTPEHVKRLNKAIKHVKSKKRALRYEPLHLPSLKMKVYADASFANNPDYSSQLGYLITLSDDHDRCHILAYASYKSRRVTRSVLGAEVYAFADSFDLAYALKVDIECIVGSRIPLHMFTDSKSLFHVVTRNSSTLEKRLMIDIASTREAYKRGEIAQIGHVRSEHNPADAFTKECKCPSLEEILETGIDRNPVDQWVQRNDKEWLR